MSFQRVLKNTTNISFSGWNFNGDGRFPTDRVKKNDKRHRTKHQRRLLKRWTKEEVNQEMFDGV